MRHLNSPEQIDDGIIVERTLASSAVTATKIGTGAVTRAKITKGYLVNWITPPVTPMVAGATGAAGDSCYISPYLYVCVSLNTWVRTEMETW